MGNGLCALQWYIFRKGLVFGLPVMGQAAPEAFYQCVCVLNP
jgi:hypothetical protein